MKLLDLSKLVGLTGYDSFQFLSSMMGGLHIDLKKYLGIEETKDSETDIDAEEIWQKYVSKNESMIVDLFHGQYKSSIVCRECGDINYSFDPNLCLSVSIPIASDKYEHIKYTFIDCGDTAKLAMIYQ